MARIPKAELARLKAEVSVQRLVEGCGVELRRQGADLVGNCPFHEDSSPSLVVTPAKNLWHCLGACARGGGPIDWVMTAQGVSFRHAVELLREASPALAVVRLPPATRALAPAAATRYGMGLSVFGRLPPLVTIEFGRRSAALWTASRSSPNPGVGRESTAARNAVSSRPGAAYSRDTDPMTQVSRPAKPGWWRLLLAAMAATLVALLGATTASAATLPELETRVGASTPVVVNIVGPHESISAGQRWGNAPPDTKPAVATGVAANTAAKACSFAGSTLVLMADGTKRAIANVKVGDKVVATDPETGEQEAKTVEHVWVHDDTVTDLVIDGDVITTAEDHPFWSVTDQRFERADELEDGEKVLGADGDAIAVSGLKIGTEPRPDLFVEDACGNRCFVEVKTGPSAGLTKNQSKAFPWIQSQGFIPRGGNAAAAGLTPGQFYGPMPVWTVYLP